MTVVLLTEVRVGHWALTVERDGTAFAVSVIDLRDERTRLTVESGKFERALSLAHEHVIREGGSEETANALSETAKVEVARKVAGQ